MSCNHDPNSALSIGLHKAGTNEVVVGAPPDTNGSVVVTSDTSSRSRFEKASKKVGGVFVVKISALRKTAGKREEYCKVKDGL